MLEVSHLSFFYEIKKHIYLPKEKVFVLKDLCFSLATGENLLVYGESGCGKSTLGKIIAGMLRANEGEVLLDGEQINAISPQKIQYVFQDQKTALNPYQTMCQAILNVAQNFDLKVDLDSELALFGLKNHILSLKPLELSSGEVQRVGLLRALMLRPRVLICDEVTASLDLPRAFQILQILKEYQARHAISYIFISHTCELFSLMCSKTLKL